MSKLQLIKLNKLKYSEDDILEVFELLEDEDLHPQDIVKQTNRFSGRQIKKLRYIKRHMLKRDFDDLLTTKYYISSIERRIKERKKRENLINKSKKKKKQ